jgi:formate/nitrite transporter FocA (FNT family)
LSASDSAKILRDVIENGQSELERATPGLAFSGFVAGLNVSFGAIAMGVLEFVWRNPNLFFTRKKR